MANVSYNAASMASRHNRRAVEESEFCGCFYCCKLFAPHKIIAWTDDGATALCPYCSVDAVLPTRTVAVTVELLADLKKTAFGSGR